MIQWNLSNPTTAGTKEIGLLLYLHDTVEHLKPTMAGTKDISLLVYLYDTVEPLKPDYGWDQRNWSVIIAT
jgi:hypothetical protein